MTVIRLAPPLRQGITVSPRRQQRRWGTTLFMVAIHALALLALLPRFWSLQAIGTLLVLYWLTACVGSRSATTASWPMAPSRCPAGWKR
jgi:hypothetical protein